MKKLRLFFVTLFFVLTNISSLYSATTYPIQLTAQLLPPYGNRLSDYVVDGMERINITALQRDLSWNRYEFYLQMQVKRGSNILLRASAQYQVTPGFVTQLSANALFSRLAEVVVSNPRLQDNGYCLPEGAYEFVFQAFDATKRNVPVSEPVYCYAYLSKMQPCRCLFPADNECVNYTKPSITFVWMEPTAALPTANKYYDLEIYEMPESFEGTTGEADAIVMSTSPIYKEEKLPGTQTMHLVPQSAGLFIKGRSYAWRVRTHFGTEPYTGNDPYKPSDYIENRGYSKLSIFHFKKCAQENVWAKEEGNEVKTNLALKPIIEKVDTTDSKAVVVWKNEQKNFPCGYEVEWNLVNALDSWERKIVGPGESRCELEKLKQGVKYVTRVRGLICSKRNPADTIRSAYSDTLHFQLDKNDATPCGREIDKIENFISLRELSPGSWITANGHDIKVLDCTPTISGNDTTFSGHGLVSYGFLTNLVSLKVQFDNVKINENRELMQGVISSVTDKDNSLDFNLNGLANKNSAGTGPAPMQETFGFSESVASGSVGILKTEGKTEVVAKNEKNEPTPIGEMMVNEKGDFSCVQNNPYLDDNVGSVTFSPQEDRNTPFDYEQGVFRKSLSISDYYDELGSPWIAVPAGESTTIKATLKLKSGSPVKPEDIYFVCRTKKETIKLNATDNGDGNFSIPIFGGSATNYLEVLAVADTSKDKKSDCSQLFTLGRAKVLSMKKESYTLHILPFRRDKSTIDITSIKDTLDKIYKPLGKTFNVVVEESFGEGDEYDFVANGINVEGSGFMETETVDMMLLKSLYGIDYGFTTEGKHAYLFVLPESKSVAVRGDMPRNKPVGYVFVNSSEEFKDGRTVAHELGHGLFTFDHAFEYYDGEKGSSDNLMDYKEDGYNTNLKVWQWNVMDTHKDYVLPFFEDDENGMLKDKIKKFYDDTFSDPWEKYSYAKVTSDWADDFKSKYGRILHGNFSYGKLQNEVSSESLTAKPHTYSYDKILGLRGSKLTDDCRCHLKMFKYLSEEIVKTVYETGSWYEANMQNIDSFANDPNDNLEFCVAWGSVGAWTVLSKSVFNEVSSAFYNKSLDPNFVLSYDEKSKLSEDLHIYNYFQKYFLDNFVSFVDSNLKNNKDYFLNNQDSLSKKHEEHIKKAGLPNFSRKIDIFGFDFYGLMGGTQKIVVDYDVYEHSDSYLLEIKIKIQDWYGADFDDICGDDLKHRMACMNAFFWLQHHYGCSPFKTEIVYKDYVWLKKE